MEFNSSLSTLLSLMCLSMRFSQSPPPAVLSLNSSSSMTSVGRWLSVQLGQRHQQPTRPDPHLGVVSLIVSLSGEPPLQFELASVAIGTDRPLQPRWEQLVAIVVVIVPLLAALQQHKSVTQLDIGGEPPPDYFHPCPLNNVVSVLPDDKRQGRQ